MTLCLIVGMAEKGLNELPRELRALFTRASDALSRDNFDYAIDLLTQVLAKEPAVFECRKALRAAQARKAGGGTGFFKKMLSSVEKSPMVAKGQLALRKDPAEALQIAEHVLNSDPNNTSAHRLVIEASGALGYTRTQVLSFEVLVHLLPKDHGIAIQFANALADAGEVARGVKVLQELYRQFPNENDIHQALKNLSARNTLSQGGYQTVASGTGSYRDILKDKEEAELLEQQNREVKPEATTDRLIREYEGRLKTESNNLKLLRSLAELYTLKGQYDLALEMYQRIKTSDIGADASIDKAIADTTGKKFDARISSLDPNALDYPERLAEAQAEKQAYQLSECQKRVERFPTDLQLRFELAQLYFHAGKIGEAIQEFQKAKLNPHRKVASMNYLAQCYAKRKMYDLAKRSLEEAIKEKPAFDDEKKDLVYNLGSVLESMDRKDEAIEQFKLIYEVDIGFKDVAAKVDDFYSSQG